MRSILFLLFSCVALVVFIACTSPAPTPAPTQEPILTPTKLSTATPQSTTATTPVVEIAKPTTAVGETGRLLTKVVSAQHQATPLPPLPRYARSCETMHFRLRMADNEEEFADLLDLYSNVSVPPEFQDFHSAIVGAFEAQMQEVDGEDKYVGLSQATQIAYEKRLEIIENMSEELLGVLYFGECIQSKERDYAVAFLEAKERLAQIEPGQPMTVREYGEACVDVETARHTFNSVTEGAQDTAENWSRLTPPPELEKYHSLFLAFYRGVVETNTYDYEPEFLAAVSAEISGLDGETVDALPNCGLFKYVHAMTPVVWDRGSEQITLNIPVGAYFSESEDNDTRASFGVVGESRSASGRVQLLDSDVSPDALLNEIKAFKDDPEVHIDFEHWTDEIGGRSADLIQATWLLPEGIEPNEYTFEEVELIAHIRAGEQLWEITCYAPNDDGLEQHVCRRVVESFRVE